MKKYIYPLIVIKSLIAAIKDLKYFKRYKKIITQLYENGQLKKAEIRKDGDNLMIGINLNPELLVYSDDSQESVELKIIADRMKKYTSFLEQEGILSSVKAEYERVLSKDFYGYISKISFDFRNFEKSKFTYDISYLTSLLIIIIVSVITAIAMIF